MIKFKYLIPILFLVNEAVLGQTIKNGNWKGSIHYDGIEVPFNFEWSNVSSTQASIVISNGKERIPIHNVAINGDSLFIPLHVFDSELRIKYANGSMVGEWHKNYHSSQGPKFTATFNQPRFNKPSTHKPDIVKPKWKIELQQPTGVLSNAVGLFNQSGDYISGTLMTEVGDYRYFEGIVDKDSIRMSSFDGVHAFLLTCAYTNDKLTGTLYYEPGYSEKLIGQADNDASIQDPFSIITVEPGVYKPYYDILTAGGEYDVIDKDSLDGKVVIIQLMGTWCPNSLDQTNYLTHWYRQQNPDKVKLIAVTYEPGNKAYSLKRIKKYKKDMNIPYPMYVGGSLSKGQAALAFPNMDRINAFPTLVIIDKQGYIRYIDSYFNGPATGSYFQDFDKEFNTKTNELLNE